MNMSIVNDEAVAPIEIEVTLNTEIIHLVGRNDIQMWRN